MINDIIIKELGEHLQGDSDTKAFLLVDPSLREPFPAEWAPVASAASWTVPARHPGLSKDQLPRLIQLENRNVALLQASVIAACSELADPEEENQAGFCIGGWLLTGQAVDGAVLADHLARCMRVTSSVRPRSMLLRWPDRRVLEWMWPVLSEDQRNRLIGPLITWSTLDRRSYVHHYRATGSSAVAPSIVLESNQLAHAERSAIAQDLIRGWQSFADDLPADYLHQVAQAVTASCGTGLKNRQDLALLGAYILQLHPRLTAHPRVREAMEVARAGNETLATALGAIPDPEGWDAIRDDLAHGRYLNEIEQNREVYHG